MKKFLLTLACMLSVCLAALAQNVLVKGVVTDAVTKETIPGAAILVNGAADNGTVTDHEGKYKLLSRRVQDWCVSNSVMRILKRRYRKKAAC